MNEFTEKEKIKFYKDMAKWDKKNLYIPSEKKKTTIKELLERNKCRKVRQAT